MIDDDDDDDESNITSRFIFLNKIKIFLINKEMIKLTCYLYIFSIYYSWFLDIR